MKFEISTILGLKIYLIECVLFHSNVIIVNFLGQQSGPIISLRNV